MTSKEQALVAPYITEIDKNVLNSSIELKQKRFEDKICDIKYEYQIKANTPLNIINKFIIMCFKVAYITNKKNKILDYQKEIIIKVLATIFNTSSIIAETNLTNNLIHAESYLENFINDSYKITKIRELKFIYRFLKFVKRQFIK